MRAAQRRAAAPPARRARGATASRRSAAAVVDDDATSAAAADDGAGAPPPKRDQTKLVILLSAITAVVIAAAGFAFSLSPGADEGPEPAPVDTPVPMTTFRDPETGISVEYPRAWREVEVPVAEYRLAVDAGNNAAFTIRVVPIQTPATAENLENFKAVTDGLVASNSTVKVLKEQAISLNGMLGYYYFYTFTDRDVAAVHAHYFLFSGNKMNIIVFQTLPDDFEPMAATFDKIAESFRSDPNVGAAAASTITTSTTVAG